MPLTDLVCCAMPAAFLDFCKTPKNHRHYLAVPGSFGKRMLLEDGPDYRAVPFRLSESGCCEAIPMNRDVMQVIIKDLCLSTCVFRLVSFDFRLLY